MFFQQVLAQDLACGSQCLQAKGNRLAGTKETGYEIWLQQNEKIRDSKLRKVTQKISGRKQIKSSNLPVSFLNVAI